MTAVAGGSSCDMARGSCRSPFPGRCRGRMEGNDSVKEVTAQLTIPVQGI